MSSSGLIHRFLSGKMPEPEVDLVLPRDNPHKMSMVAEHPILFAIEATADEKSTTLDGDDRVLLGTRNINWTSQNQDPKGCPQWMHLSHDGIEFTTFVRHTLNAYGLGKEADAVLASSAFHRLVSMLERSAFQGKRFEPGHGAVDIQLPGQTTELKINFMAVPYFSLQKARRMKGNESHRSKMCWVQPLVQSAYHLDSSTARENQQSVRRLHRHITEIVHVPQLWILSIGQKFIATCSPTPLRDNQQSAITTRTMGRVPFPPTIRVTLSSGFVFDLDRKNCLVWFKFVHHIKSVIEASLNKTLNQKDCSFTLQNDNSLVDARRWQSILHSHPDTKPLLILLDLATSKSNPERVTVTIPLEGKYSSTEVENSTEKEDTSEYPTVSTEDLSPKTLDEYKLPYYWDSPRPGEQRNLIIAQRLTDLDRRILCDHTRRKRAMDNRDCPSPRQNEADDDIYYTPPPYVLAAAKSQCDAGDAGTLHESTDERPQPATGKPAQPIFRWSIRKDTPEIDRDGQYYPYSRATSRPMKKFPEKIGVLTADESTPTQRMKSLLAHIHREILFSSNTHSSKNYNSLPLKTKSDVDSGIAHLRESKEVNSHILALFSSFSRQLSYILNCFIDREYDCIVKGKIWAAVHELVMSTTSSSDALLTLYCETFAIPVRKFKAQIEELRDGLSGAEEHFVTQSMVKAFIQVVLLLADLASGVSRLSKGTDSDGESSKTSEEETEDESIDQSAGPDFLDHSVYSKTKPGPPMKSIIEQGGARSISYDEDDVDPLPSRRRYARSEISSGPRRRRSSRTRREDTPFDVNDHVDQIIGYLDNARDECCAMFGSKGEGETTYSGVDCGRIVSLVLDSVLRGHSMCESIPTLNIEEIYTTWATSLELEARNRPSKGLLIDINLLREELKIVTRNIVQQFDLIGDLCEEYGDSWDIEIDDNTSSSVFESLYSTSPEGDFVVNMSTRKTLQEIKANLGDRQDVFEELTTRVDELERQIVQRVDIIQEDHGKAILVFTIVSTIFLPLSFVSSYMGMNTSDIRDMEPSQALFWEAATPFTVVVVVTVLVVAYNVNRIQSWLPRGPAF